MDTHTNFKISIPKPCHEDWNKFTPDEKGAFCKVCSKSVYDFTKKEPEQIKTILIEEMSAGNKVCGRFNEDQLDTPTLKGEVQELDAYSLNFRKIKRFAMALFLVFGGFLFHSTKSTAQKIMGKMAMPQYHEPVRGEIAISKDPEPVVKDTARTIRDSMVDPPKVFKCRLPLKGDVMVEPIEDKYVLGGVSAAPVENPEPPVVKGNAIVEPVVGQAEIETVPIVDSVAIIEELVEVTMGDIDILPIDEPIKEDTVITVVEDYPMMGLVIAITDYVDTPILINPIPNDSIQNIIDGEFAVEESTYVTSPQPSPEGERANKVLPEGEDLGGALEVYPNPSSNGMITLHYNLKKDGIASISLFDLKGNLVKTLLPFQSLYASSYETKYDVSDLNAGIYFCELIAGQNKTTTRIVISK